MIVVRTGALSAQANLGMTREVAFPVRILNENKTAGGNVPNLSVTGLVLD